MRRLFNQMLIAGVMLALSATTLYANANNHYGNGVEGIKGATVAPPGFYYRMYNFYYTADEIMDKSGDELAVDFDVNVAVMANRFIWVTDKKFLGADFFMDVVIPVVNTDIEIGALGVNEDSFGLGDINIEPFGLAWHGARYDAAAAFSVYLPTGEFDLDDPSSPGKGYTTFMATLGGTLYLDDRRTWSASILGRYEIHTEKDDTDLTPGDDFHLEWGIGKSFAKVWEAGLAGYCQWQVTDDSGSDAVNKSTHDQVFAIGPEAGVFLPRFKAALNLRALWEFDAEDRSEGNAVVLTLTKIF
ncbi:MAG: transporter [Desulfobacteraceae bacterium]|nr:transporter [Desulfobacteraceae bacterium]